MKKQNKMMPFRTLAQRGGASREIFQQKNIRGEKRHYFVLLILITIILFSNHASAAGLVPCGGTGQDPCSLCSIWSLSNNLINLMLFIALPILTIVLVVGGFMFVTGSSNPKQIEQAKSLLSAGITGVFIAFLGWLIVDTVIKTLAADGAFTPAWNKINECPAPTQPPTPAITAPTHPAGTYTDAEARAILTGLGIPINKANCSSPSQTDCTSLDGIPQSTIARLTELKTSCVGVDCGFIVTGGTEAGHETHGPNQSIIDVAPNKKDPTSSDFVTLREIFAKTSGATSAYCEKGRVQVACNSGQADHIHVVFPR